MPQVRAEFNYQPSADAQRYEIFYGTQRLGFSDTLQFTTDLELEYGTHNFSVRGVNVDGTGPFRSTQVVLEEPYVPLPTPGSIGALEVSLVILGGGVGGGEPPVDPPATGSNADRIATALAGYTVPFAGLVTPADPVTTQTINVTANDSSGLQSALTTDGALVNIPAGTYTISGQLFPGSNVDVVADNGATVNISENMSLINDVFRWTGGVINGGGTSAINTQADDMLWDNVRFDDMFAMLSEQPCNRHAVINSTLAVSGSSYFSQSSSGFFPGQAILYSDLIFANNDQYADAGNFFMRIQALERGIVVGNRFDPAGNQRAVRIHRQSTNIYVSGNTVTGGTGLDVSLWGAPADGTDPALVVTGAVWFTDNVVYNAASTQSSISLDDVGGPKVVQDNTTYCTVTSPSTDQAPFSGGGAGEIITGNIRLPYQTPPSFADWLTDFTRGADH